MADAVAELPAAEVPVEATPGPKISLRKSRLLPEFPYPGLRPFRKEEWPVFCGRSEIVDELLSALGATHFVPVLGTSGCGKSSLIKAGLIATLEREHGALGSAWCATEMRPGNSPMWNLTEALWRATHDHLLGSPEELSQMRASLGRGPGGIARVLKEYGFPEDRHLLILVDQFEELFRFGVLGGQEEIQLFTDQLIDVFSSRPHGIHVTLTMRADFIADCARWPRLADALNRTAYLLRWLTEAEMRAAIATPARLYRGTVDPDLVDRMIRDVGGEQDQLPIVQHALMWMWARAAATAEPGHLTLADYDGPEVRGVEGALSLHADQIYESLATARPAADAVPRDLRPATKRLFQALSDVDANNRAIRRPCAFGELCAITGCAAEEMQYIIDQFRKPGTSFLMPDDVPQLQDNDTIDVSHEALIRQWSKMQGRGADDGWLPEERRDAENWRALAREVRKFRDAKQRGRERFLSGDQNDDLQAWWKQRAPSAAWAARYSADAKQLFPLVGDLLEQSAKRARRAALLKRFLVVAPVALVLLGFASFAWMQNYALHKAEDLKIAADAARGEAEQKQRQLQDQLTANQARDRAEDWRETEALVLAESLMKQKQPNALAEGIAYRALTRQHISRAWPREIAVDWAHENRFVALMTGDNRVQILDPFNDAVLQTADFVDLRRIYNVAISPDGSHLAVADEDGTFIALWPAIDSKAIRIPIRGQVGILWFTPDGKWIVGCDDDQVIVIDARTGVVAGHWTDTISYDVAISSDSTFLATLSSAGHLQVRSFADLALPVYEAQLDQETAGAPTIDAKRGLVALPMFKDKEDKVVLFDFNKKTQQTISYSAETAPVSVQFSHDGSQLAIGSADGSIRKFDVDSMIGPKAPQTFPERMGDALPFAGNQSSVNMLRFSPDDSKLVAVMSDGASLVIDLKTRSALPLKPMGGTSHANFAGGDHVITMDDDQTLRLWRPEASLVADRFPASSTWGLTTSVSSVRQAKISTTRSTPQLLGLLYDGEGKPIVTAKLGDKISYFSTGNDQALPLFASLGETRLLKPAGKSVIYVDATGSVKVQGVDGTAAKEIAMIDLDKTADVFFDGAQHVVQVGPADDSGSALGAVAGPGVPMEKLPKGQTILALASEAMLLNTGKSDAVLLVPSQTGDHKGVELPLADSNASVMAGALSPDGLYAAVLQDNGTVSVWNTRRAALIALFGEPDQKISNLAFPPDLNAIDALGQDGSVYRWRIFTDTIDLADAVSAAIPKNLASDRKQRILDEASTPPASAQ